MGFFAQQNRPVSSELKGLSADFLHRHGCSVCPLNKQSGLKHPHMEATGAAHPTVYMLGGYPTKQDDRTGEQFNGEVNQLLHDYIPSDLLDQVRWNNIVRTHSEGPPTAVAIECCRPSVVQDIERTKPKAIFGFGPQVLQWVLKQSGILKWCGRRVPVKIGNHTCWFFPLMAPEYVQSTIMYKSHKKGSFSSEVEFAFTVELRRAFDALENLPEPVIHTQEQATANIEIVTGSNGWKDVSRIKEMLDAFGEETTIGFDWETNCKRPYKEGAKLLTAGFANKDLAFSFALHHKQALWTPDQLAKVLEHLKNFLYKAKCRKVVHMLPFELEWSIVFFGRKVARAGKWGDSVSQAFILDERMKMSKPDAHSLELLCLQYFGIDVKGISGNLDRSNLDNEDLSEVLTYNAIDARYHRHLYLAQAPRLKAERLQAVYQHALRRIPTVVLTQVKGIPVNKEIVDGFYTKYTKQRTKIEKEIAALPIVERFEKIKRKRFRPSANHDIKFVVQKMLKKDLAQVDEKALKTIKHPLITLLLKWRKVDKLRGTYVLPYRPGHEKSNVWPDGKIHPILSTTRTRTWRTASQEPNSQNQPKHGAGKEVRKQINPGNEKRVVAFDFAGIQARNVAMESKDAALVKAYWEKYDIHSAWSNKIIKAYPKWIEGGLALLKDKAVAKEYRQRAKNEFVFPSFFGARPKSLARSLRIPEEVAEALNEEFWDEFPDIKKWHQELEIGYRKTGYVTGLSGFRRRAPISPNELINSPIQSDESIIVLTAMSELSELEDPRFQANMEIHDDLTFIWPKHEIEKNAEVVVREMIKCHFDWINVPLVVEMSVGTDWSNTEAVGEFSSADWTGSVNYKAEKEDPNGGNWSDGTGWASLAGRKRK